MIVLRNNLGEKGWRYPFMSWVRIRLNHCELGPFLPQPIIGVGPGFLPSFAGRNEQAPPEFNELIVQALPPLNQGARQREAVHLQGAHHFLEFEGSMASGALVMRMSQPASSRASRVGIRPWRRAFSFKLAR